MPNLDIVRYAIYRNVQNKWIRMSLRREAEFYLHSFDARQAIARRARDGRPLEGALQIRRFTNGVFDGHVEAA